MRRRIVFGFSAAILIALLAIIGHRLVAPELPESILLGGWGIYQLNLESMQLVHLTDKDIQYFAVSPNKQCIAFVDGPKSMPAGVYLLNRKGEIELLIDEQELGVKIHSYTTVTWMPDGHRVLFTTQSEDPYEVRLYTVDVKDKQVELLKSFQSKGEYHTVHTLELAPDKKRLLIDANYGEIHLLDLQNLEMHYLTDGFSATWSPDGTQVIFVGDDFRSIHTITPSSGFQAVMYESTPDNRLCARPTGRLAWAPDGHAFVFTEACHEADIMELYELDWQTQEVRLIAELKDVVPESLTWIRGTW